MKGSRFALSALLAVLGGAVIALGPGNHRSGAAAGLDPGPHLHFAYQSDGLDAEPWGGVGDETVAEPPGHFDDGPVPGDRLAADPAANVRQYRYEYPEGAGDDARDDSDEIAHESDEATELMDEAFEEMHDHAAEALRNEGDEAAYGEADSTMETETSEEVESEVTEETEFDSTEEMDEAAQDHEAESAVHGCPEYLGHSLAYPEEQYAYPEIDENPADGWCLDYGGRERYEGEPGEALGRSLEYEPYGYFFIDPAQYDQFDYYATGPRRSVLSAYVDALGVEALALAARFKDSTGIALLGLADHLPGVPAFLAALRMMEQHELGMDVAVELLQQSVKRLAPRWIQGILGAAARASRARPAEPEVAAVDAGETIPTSSTARPLLEVFQNVLRQSVDRLDGTARDCVRGLRETDWTGLMSDCYGD